MDPERRIGLRAAMALLPMAFAVAGGFVDERTHLGFSNWRSACRAAGLSPSSLLGFTFELLPAAVLGALLGGIAVQIIGLYQRHRPGAARASLAAHGGCVLGMGVGLPVCTLAAPLPWLLGAEALLAMAAATVLYRFLGRRSSCGASVVAPTRRLPSA